MTRLRILVVDSDATRARGVASLLEERLDAPGGPVKVYRAGSLESALVQLAERGADAMVLYPELPDAKGIASYNAIRSSNSWLPIVVATPEGRFEPLPQALAGARSTVVLAQGEATAGKLADAVAFLVCQGAPDEVATRVVRGADRAI